MKSEVLIRVRCTSCCWSGFGDPNDDCYQCKESDSLTTIDPDDEVCFECGLRKSSCDCDYP
jgi:hypothetical protein